MEHKYRSVLESFRCYDCEYAFPIAAQSKSSKLCKTCFKRWAGTSESNSPTATVPSF